MEGRYVTTLHDDGFDGFGMFLQIKTQLDGVVLTWGRSLSLESSRRARRQGTLFHIRPTLRSMYREMNQYVEKVTGERG